MTSSKPARRATRVLVLVVALSLVAPLVTPGSAGATDKLVKAREHFVAGQSLFRQRSYQAALKEFMAAFVLDPSPVLVYNIARTHEEAGDVQKAVRFFTNYLKISPRARNARAVKKKLRRLKKQLKNLPRSGYLTVVSQPAGAAVHLNGRPIGQTPLNAAGVPVGSHRIEIFLNRFDVHASQVEVTPGQTTRLDVKLKDRPSTVLISTVPAGATATVYLPEPKNLGPCPCVVELGEGRYKLAVALAGYQPKELVFQKQPGETLKVNVALVPAVTMGKLAIDSNVPGAEVRIDGRPAGRLPLAEPLMLRPAIVLVEVFAAGMQPWRGKARIETGQLTRIRALLERAPTIPGPIGITPTPVVRYPSGGSSAQRTWGWVTTSIGIASLVAGGLTMTFSLLDKHTFDNGTFFRLDDGSTVRNDITMAEALALEDRASTLMNASIGLYAGGGALLLTGIILLATDGGGDSQSLTDTRFQFSPVPGGAVMGVQMPFD